jgi:hypothetical protein
MSYETFGENRVFLSHTDRTSSSVAYVHRFTTSRTFSITPYVCYVGARGEPHLLSTVHLFSDS